MEENAELEQLLSEAEHTTTMKDRLEKYYEVLSVYPNNIDARLNIAKCHINLGNYDLALQSLNFVSKVDPQNQEIYELFIQLSRYADDISYAYTALDLAQQNHNETFLSKRPEAPKLSLDSGEYNSRVNFEIDTDNTSGDIFVTIENNGELGYDFTMKYTGPIPLLRGNNTVSAYTVQNGIPSETVTAEYSINYEPTEVTFKESSIEKLVRLVLNRPTGPITDVACESVDQLIWSDLRGTVSSDAAYKSIKISSLEDLKYFPRLTRLDLEYQGSITDYSPLSNCPLITTINFKNCHLSSVRFVEFTPRLTHLSVYNYNSEWVYMDDIDSLAKLTTLRSLDTRGNSLGSQIDERSWRIHHLDDVIKSNPQITSLNINSDHLSNWNVLLDLDLTHINTWGIRNTNTSVLSKLQTLQNLYIWYGPYEYWNQTSAKSLSFLSNLPNLKKLGLGGVDNVSDLKYVKELENLEYLRLAEDSGVVSNNTAMSELQEALPNCQIVTE